MHEIRVRSCQSYKIGKESRPLPVPPGFAHAVQSLRETALVFEILRQPLNLPVEKRTGNGQKHQHGVGGKLRIAVWD